jgi:uncharacterized membrane protein YoaK (UPF0700 family)
MGAAVLAFSAGLINVIALLGFSHEAATHVTGIFSLFSISLFEGDSSVVAQTAAILFFFFFGAFISGVVIRDAHLRMGRRYGFALALECFILLLSTYGFVRGSLWGEHFAGMAAGLQNAMASTYSGAIVRTTHLTGVLTDLGALCGNRAAGKMVNTRQARLLAIIIGSFVCGGVAGAGAYAWLGSLAMLAPAGVIGAAAITYELFRRKQLAITEALLG